MFDEITRTEGAARAARKSAYILGSTVLQVILVACLVLFTERLRSAAKAEAVVDVRFIRAAPSPPPPPAASRKKPDRPRDDAPGKVVPPSAMIQPKEVPQEPEPTRPEEPPEPDHADAGAAGGVVGGVPGASVEDAPRYLATGFRKPQEKQPGCVRSSIRVPQSLQGFVSGPITVRFAVRRDGSVGQVQILGQDPGPRIAEIIRRGLSACEWIPGADAQGRPTHLWVILPIRFEGG